MNSRTLFRVAALAAPFVSLGHLAAQGDDMKVALPAPSQVEVKGLRPVDPVKGIGSVTPFTEADRQLERRRPHRSGARGEVVLQAAQAAAHAGPVLYSTASDGRTWANGDTFKAAFGADGFTYIPFLGAEAPRDFPVRFALASVKVGGTELAPMAKPAVSRAGDRVVLDHGPVREVYDLTARSVEQTFVVDDAQAGDVEVTVRVDSELVEDAALPGVQFRNALGGVLYGDAFLVAGADRRPVAASFADGLLTVRVAAAQRGPGAVVIDPVISTDFTGSASGMNFDRPDVSFDASSGRYLVVWEREFSAADIDVFGEFRREDGSFVIGSNFVVDGSSEYWSRPRVANLNAYNRFLVVAEKYVAANPVGQQYSIWGRTVGAFLPVTIGAPFEVSNSADAGDKRDPDVGGDPSLLTPTYWTVVYTRELSPTDHDILGRQVNEDGTPRGGTLYLENTGNTIHRNAEISHGDGLTTSSAQRWAVVFTYRFSATDNDIYAMTLDWNGNVVQGRTAIDTSPTSHSWPSVSSLATEFPGGPAFGISYEDDSNQNDLVATVVSSALAPIVVPTYLASRLGQNQFIASRIETDGCRFVLAYAAGLPAFATTLGVVGTHFVVQEMPQQLGSGHDAWEVNLVSRAACGGTNTGYGVVFMDLAATPDKIVVATYDGHGHGGFAVRATGCNGLGIGVTGQPLLGRTFTATVEGVGSDLSGILVGATAPATPVCTGCQLGVSLSGPLLNVPNTASLPVSVPCVHTLVGGALSLQGYAVGSGTCLTLLRLGDTLDVTVE